MDPKEIKQQRIKRYQELTAAVAAGKKISPADHQWLNAVQAQAVASADGAKPTNQQDQKVMRLQNTMSAERALGSKLGLSFENGMDQSYDPATNDGWVAKLQGMANQFPKPTGNDAISNLQDGMTQNLGQGGHMPGWMPGALDGLQQARTGRLPYQAGDFSAFKSAYPELRPENVQSLMDAFYGKR